MSQAQTVEAKDCIGSEHQLQLKLLDALGRASENNAGEERELLDQLIDFSEVHFMSEQLLMRQYNYEHYEEHVADHEQIMELMSRLRDINIDSRLNGAVINQLRTLIVNHIALKDQQLHQFLMDNH